MSLRTEGLLLHTFAAFGDHFRSFQVIAHGLVREVVRAWSLSNRSSKLCAGQAENVLC